MNLNLIYSLPFNCPIEWPVKPNYPIPSPIRDLPLAYTNTLFHSNDSNQPLQFVIDNFARLLISLTLEQSPETLVTLLRSLILPAKDFDKRWRYTIPEVFKPDTRTVESGKVEERLKLGEDERGKLMECYERWKDKVKQDTKVAGWTEVKVVPETDKNEELRKETLLGEGAMELVQEETVAQMERDKPDSWVIEDQKIGDWLRDLETLETQLQSLLLLTLVCLPLPTIPPPAPRRKKDPQRNSSTLDPEILLDFLTDRLQVWAAIKSMTGTRLGKDVSGVDNARIEEERDEVQAWWEDIVEPLYSSRLLSELLLHHREKLFPSSSSTQALSTAASYVPSPSPYKQADRSLLSLDKSARRREWLKEKMIPESPTMKRLGMNGGSSRNSGGGMMLVREEVFKIPAPKRKTSLPSLNLSSTSNSTIDLFQSTVTDIASITTSGTTTTTSSSKSRARKQERPRPSTSTSSTSTRGDNMVSSLKGLFNRREVSLARRPSIPSIEEGEDGFVLKEKKKSEGMTAEGRTRKRKPISPRKVPPSESTFLSNRPSTSFSSRILAEDTPVKPLTTNSNSTSMFNRPSLSFAALGAAFRPGMPPPMELPRGIPKAPVLSDDDDDDSQDEMDWENEEGGKGGDSWKRGRIGGVMPGTPVRRPREGWVIPDT